jgi:hypothetical protein
MKTPTNQSQTLPDPPLMPYQHVKSTSVMFKQRGTVQTGADTWDTRMASSSYLLSTHARLNGAYDSAHVSPSACSDRICRQYARRRVLRGSTDRALEFAWLLAHCRPRRCSSRPDFGETNHNPAWPSVWSPSVAMPLLASRDSVWSTNH